MPDIVFMGTPEFAVPPMEYLLNAGHRISLLVCQPDKRKGRGHKYLFPPTKQFALDHDIEVFQPTSVRTPETLEKLAATHPDFFIVVAYGRILPKSVLELPRKGCINVHASLLPNWRGAAPIQFALLNGDERTGVCTMLMDEGMDTGDILLSRETEIPPDECVDGLSERLSLTGAELIVETVENFDSLVPRKQDHEKATYTRLLEKEDRHIRWHKEALEIHRQFRALTPTPGVFTRFRGKRLIVKSMRLAEESEPMESEKPGTVVSVEKNGLTVSCGKGAVSILSCQPENKKSLSARDFVNGYRIQVGEVLGDDP
ncbi:MAG: methionyl-tRNA formyltransferase [Proteobacteria bacterium]|nr:methionyl-tRNA formyltransferase [Pseudomonadota bacterium]